MYEGLIALIIILAVIFIVWYAAKWAMAKGGVGAPLPTIVDVIAAVIAIVVLIRFLLTLS